MELLDLRLVGLDGNRVDQRGIDMPHRASLVSQYFDIGIVDRELVEKIKTYINHVAHYFDAQKTLPPICNNDYEVSTFIQMQNEKEKMFEEARMLFPEKRAQILFLNKKHKRAITLDCRGVDDWVYLNAYSSVKDNEELKFPERGTNVFSGNLMPFQVADLTILGKIYEFLESGVEDHVSMPIRVTTH